MLRPGMMRRSAENARLLDALRERQALLERLAGLQRAIVAGDPLHEVLERVVEGARELLADDVAVLRMESSGGGEIAAASGIEPAALAELGDSELGDRAVRERRLVVADAVSGADPTALAAEFGPEARAAVAAPVFERAEAVASIAVASRDGGREYGLRDQQILHALAENASLALNHASALDEVVHESFHDRLTGLPNRSLLIDRLEHALARAARRKTPVGVLFCDLDSFKTINDSLGHAAGDRLLIAVAERLRESVRPGDTVARLGSDEFAVLLEELRAPGDAARAARRILDSLESPFDLGGREVYVGASVGIASGTAAPETLLRDADLAMYRAKSEGRGRYAHFEPGLHTAAVERLDLEIDLKRAVERDELELAYQPIFDLARETVVGLEALARWRHPRRGLVPPARFIPLAEESGQIIELGRWVLGEACKQAALWRARYPAFGLQVGVNVSGTQLREPGFVAEVADALAAAQLDAGGLTLEITESVLMDDAEVASRRLTELKQLGVELAIDDFGTGYSSLTYLQRFPLDNLKIERAFVEEVGSEDEDLALLRAIVELAEIFGLRPIAEGIERPGQAKRLLELGCGLGQGHFLSEPLAPSDADALLLRAGLLRGGSGALGSPAGDPGKPSPAARDLPGDAARGGAGERGDD